MAAKKNPKTGRPFNSGRRPEKRVTTNRIRGKAQKGQRSLDYLKPKQFRNYLTITEMAVFVPVDVSWLRRLEKVGRIPTAQRVKMGKLEVRLWSPEQAEEIRSIIRGHKIGRPKGS